MLRVVRNLAMFNGTIVVLQVAYACVLGMRVMEIIPLMLTAVLASIPVALPATFTLATALGARALARRGVLPTRLSAVDEAASMDVLCVDKTRTLTRNELAVTAIRSLPGFEADKVLGWAALASSDGGQDPVDTAIRAAASNAKAFKMLALTKFVPFDPANKMSEAVATDANGQTWHIVKGAFARVSRLTAPSAEATKVSEEFGGQGFRVLAVSVNDRMAGLIALSDPPRTESVELIAELHAMGVQTVMVTGDAPSTAAVVARAVGLSGAICPPGPVPERVTPQEFDVFAGILPEDKFHIVKAFQNAGHVVGMCGDGANDAPALRRRKWG